jgi:hypothetical protein
MRIWTTANGLRRYALLIVKWISNFWQVPFFSCFFIFIFIFFSKFSGWYQLITHFALFRTVCTAWRYGEYVCYRTLILMARIMAM